MYQATCEFDAAHAVFKPSEPLQLTEDKLNLQDNIANAANALKTHQATAETRQANVQQYRSKELRRFKVKSDDDMAVLIENLRAIEKEEETFLSSSKSLLETVRKKNNIGDTVEHQEMIKTRRKRGEAELAYQSFDELLHVISVGGALFTKPLRYTVSLVSGKLLKISKIEIDGYWSSMAKDGKLSAHITAVLGFVAVVFNVTFDIGDIVGFFKELWTEIGKVINSVGGTIKHFVEEGLKVAEAGFDIALVEGKKFVQDAEQVLDKAEDLIVGLGKDVVDTGGHAADEVQKFVTEVDKTLDKAGDAIVGFGNNVSRTANDFVDNADRALTTTLDDSRHFAQDSAEKIVHVAEDFQHGAETVAHEVEHTAINAANEVGDAFHHAADETVNIANKAGEVLGDAFSDIGHGITNFWRH